MPNARLANTSRPATGSPTVPLNESVMAPSVNLTSVGATSAADALIVAHISDTVRIDRFMRPP
ncbi:hypothetical protein RV134_260318 [Roseovarius sp. EC-HK134]|nr:hypothetical protein RV134_260318 [Roseovarius sp. EC-HK134]VVT10933.1 hypothetical protein RV420_290533 [Roseovarius sp. EC-SD190]